MPQNSVMECEEYINNVMYSNGNIVFEPGGRIEFGSWDCSTLWFMDGAASNSIERVTARTAMLCLLVLFVSIVLLFVILRVKLSKGRVYESPSATTLPLPLPPSPPPFDYEEIEFGEDTEFVVWNPTVYELATDSI